MRLHDRFKSGSLEWEDYYARWAYASPEEMREAADAYRGFLRQVEIDFELKRVRKSRTPAGSKVFLEAHKTALDAVDQVVGRGLLAREGTFIRPPAIIKPEMLDDFLAWEFVKMNLSLLGVKFWDPGWTPKTKPVSVCDGCTAVFRPGRKKSARFCQLCSHKAPPPPLGMSGPLQSPGDTVVVAAPKLEGTIVTGWRAVTAGLCAECGEAFFGRAGKTFCSQKCGQRQRRRPH